MATPSLNPDYAGRQARRADTPAGADGVSASVSVGPATALPDNRRHELAAWLRLNLTHGLGPAGTLNLLRALGTPEQIVAASHYQVAQVVGRAIATRLLAADDELDLAIEQSLQWAEQTQHHLITLADPAYPARLLEINDPPPLLYVVGNLSALGKPAIGIVGSRHATRTGLDNARAFATALAAQGLTVVSGLALGIDAAAHGGALAHAEDSAAGTQGAPDSLTIAVMGTGADRIYPAANRPLAKEIVRKGAILTEFPIGSAALRGNFPRRNRLIAGLSLGVLVVEAAVHSGSLITARQAAEFGREVFAIPGSIHSPVARGCHRLIRQGAKLVESAEDVISELRHLFVPQGAQSWDAGKASPAQPPNQPSNDEQRTLLARIGWDPVTIDGLMSPHAGPSEAAQMAGTLLEMELAGWIERLADGRIRRVKNN